MTNRVSLKKYTIFAKAAMMESISYKWQIWTWTLVGVMPIIITCLLWTTVYRYSSTPTINGFTLTGMIAYALIAAITSENVYTSVSFDMLTNDIYKGDLSIRVIKPISYKKQAMFSSLGSFISSLFLKTLPMLLIAFLILCFGFDDFAMPNWYNFVLYFVSMLLALLVIDSFDFMFATLAFYTGSMFGLWMTKNVIQTFLSGALIPLAFFPSIFQTILSYLPFASMIGTPVQILLGNIGGFELIHAIGLQLVWFLALYFLSELCYRSLIKKAIQAGG